MYFNQDNIPETLVYLRFVRDEGLKESDWTQMPDSPLSDSKKTEWAIYRQELRDLPTKYSNKDNIDTIVFPSKPD